MGVAGTGTGWSCAGREVLSGVIARRMGSALGGFPRSCPRDGTSCWKCIRDYSSEKEEEEDGQKRSGCNGVSKKA